MSVRILLLNYPFPFSSVGKERFDFNYGVGRVAAYLKKALPDIAETKVAWRALGPSEEFLSDCLDWKPDIVGVSCFPWNHSGVAETVNAFRERGIGSAIVLGGPSAKYLYMKHRGFESRSVYCIIGGGEIPFAAFVKCFSEAGLDSIGGSSIENLTQYKDKAFIENSTWLQPELLDLLPSPFLEGILKPGENEDVMFLEASRGCDRKCSYCFAHRATLKGKAARFSPEYLIKELQWAVSNGVIYIDFLEVSIGRDMKWLDALIDGILKERQLDAIKMYMNLHPEDFSEELAERMERLGERIEHIVIGVQSMSSRAARTMRRAVDMRKLLKNLEASAHRLPLKVEFIAGLPGDTPKSLEKALRAMYLFDIGITMNRLTVFPGSEYFDRKEEYGVVLDEDKMFQIVETPDFTAAYLDSLRGRLKEMFPAAPAEKLLYHENSSLKELKLRAGGKVAD